MSKKGKRRRWTASEKLRIVLSGMESGVEAAALSPGARALPDGILVRLTGAMNLGHSCKRTNSRLLD